ncbi:MAG: hypothetical protein GY940_06190 [bacterium]|nr:hypothetical protein [bacterium]
MPDKDPFKLKKKKRFMVTCSNNKEHVFDKILEIEESVEGKPVETEVETYCPFCSELVSFTVTGTPVEDETIMRGFREQDERREKKK